jgi:hypothetical protein
MERDSQESMLKVRKSVSYPYYITHDTTQTLTIALFIAEIIRHVTETQQTRRQNAAQSVAGYHVT